MSSNCFFFLYMMQSIIHGISFYFVPFVYPNVSPSPVKNSTTGPFRCTSSSMKSFLNFLNSFSSNVHSQKPKTNIPLPVRSVSSIVHVSTISSLHKVHGLLDVPSTPTLVMSLDLLLSLSSVSSRTSHVSRNLPLYPKT